MDNISALQHQYEQTEVEPLEYSADCYLDWDIFTFENEILERARIYKENLQALNLMADTTAVVKVKDENILKVLQTNREVYSELLKDNTNTCTKYDALIHEYKTVKQNVENLTAKNKSIERTIVELEEKETNSRKEYQQLKLALQKGIEMYHSNFDINVTTKALSDTTYEALLRFGEKNDVGPIKFIVDRTNRKVIDFHVNEVLLPEEEEDIRSKFGNLDNLPGLLCALREIVLKK